MEDNHINSANYWRKRCQAAENYIATRSIIPDTTEEQEKAKERWDTCKYLEKLLATTECLVVPPTEDY